MNTGNIEEELVKMRDVNLRKQVAKYTNKISRLQAENKQCWERVHDLEAENGKYFEQIGVYRKVIEDLVKVAQIALNDGEGQYSLSNPVRVKLGMEIELLKPGEVGLLLRCEERRLLRLAKAGRIPHVVLPDGEIRFEKSAIDQLIKEGRRGDNHSEVDTKARCLV